MKTLKRLSAAFLALCMIFALAACGGNDDKTNDNETEVDKTAELLENMSDFELPNGKATIKLNKDWRTEDVGMDTMLVAGTQLGDEAIFLFQFPKDGSMGATDFEGVESLVKQSYNTSDEKDLEKVEVSNATGAYGYTCTIQPEGSQACDGAIVYFETDNAIYSMGFIADKFDEDHQASFMASLTTFAEVAE